MDIYYFLFLSLFILIPHNIITSSSTTTHNEQLDDVLPQLKCNQYKTTIQLNANHTDHCFIYNDTSALCPNLTTALRWQRPLHNVCITLLPDSIHQLSVGDGDTNKLWFTSLTMFSIQSENVSRPASIQCFSKGSNSENGSAIPSAAAGFLFEKSSDIMFKNLIFTNCSGVVVATTGDSQRSQTVDTDILKNSTKKDNVDSDDRMFQTAVNDDEDNNNLRNSATVDNSNNYNNIALFTFSKSSKIIFAGVTFDKIKGSSVVLADSNQVNFDTVTIRNGIGNAIKIIYQNVTIEEDRGEGKEEVGNGNLIRIWNSYFSSNKASPSTNRSSNSSKQTNETITAAHAFTTKDKGSVIAVLLMENVKDNLIKIISSCFENNAAMYGGAVYIAASIRTQNNTLVFNNVLFNKSQATRSGGSIYVGDFSRIETTNQIILQNTNFTRNTADHVNGGAAIFSYNSYLWLLGYNRFINNSGTALVLGSTTTKVNDTFLLEGNTGIYGGAMFLYKCSTIVLSPTSNTIFRENTATKDGGALFVLHYFKKGHSQCFFMPQNRSGFVGSVHFVNNIAGLYGNHIYTSTLKLCQHLSFANADKEHIYFIPEEEDNSVSTAASRLEIDEKEWKDVIPGAFFSPHVFIKDELNQPIHNPVQIHIANDSWLKDTYVIRKNSEVTIALHGEPSTQYEVDFTVDSELGQLTKKLNVKLESCPTQFIWNRTRGGKCECHSQNYASKCSSDNTLHVLPDYWLSPEGNSYSCPEGYCARCNSTKGSGIQRYCLYLWKAPCNDTRDQTSRLCSKCRKGLSVSFGSTECVDASKTKNYIYIPLLAIGLIVFSIVVMTACNYDIYAGFFTPVILFYQFVPNFLKMKNGSSLIMFIFTVFHSDENSLYNVPFSQDYDDLHKVWIRFVTALMWVLFYAIFILITKLNKFNCYQVAVFRCWPFVFLLSFIDTIKFAMSALRGITIDKQAYVYHYADEKYFGDRHIILFIAALVLVVSTLIFTSIMLYLGVREKLHMSYDDRENTFDSIISHCKLKWMFGYYTSYTLLFILMKNLTWELLLLIIFTGFFTFNQPFKSTSTTEAFLTKYFNFNHFEVLVYLDMMVIGLINQNPDYEDINKDKGSRILDEILLVLPAVGLLLMVGCTLFGILKKRRYSLSKYSICFISHILIAQTS